MSKKNEYNVIVSIILIMILIITSICGNISLAIDETELTKITDENQKKELLGISNNENLGILGIASKYSVFVKDDLTVNDADSEGKVAVGGAFTANTDYRYQTGCEYDNYNENSNEAKIVVGKGPIKNVATDFGWNNKTNSMYESNKNVSVNTGFNYEESTYKDSEGNDIQYDLSTYKEANLFDFDEQFEYLNSVSQKLKGMTNGTVETAWTEDYKGNKTESYVTGTIVKDHGNINIHENSLSVNGALVLKGTNEKLNVFNIPDQYLESGYWRKLPGDNIVLDVPYGSYCVINVTSTGNVKFGNEIGPISIAQSIYYPMSDEEIANSNINNEDVGYLGTLSKTGDSENQFNYSKNVDGSLRVFHRISPGVLRNKDNSLAKYVDINNASSKYILWNLPDATSFELSVSYFVGSILAPNADGSDSGKSCKAQISGTVMCKSYTGTVQFGYIPFDLNLADININVQDSSKANISGTELELYDLKTNDNGELILNENTLIDKWKTTDKVKKITLPTGGYILKEYQETNDCNEIPNNNYQAFEVKSNYTYSGNGEKTGSIQINTPRITKGYTEEKAKLLESSTGRFSTIASTWDELYNSFHGAINTMTDYGKHRISKMTFKINDQREDKSKKLYFCVDAEGGGTNNIYCDLFTELLSWTEASEQVVTFEVPIVNSLYKNLYVQFYTADGNKVSEGVTVSDVYAYWYTGTDGTVSKTYESENLETSVSANTISVINEKVTKRATNITSTTYESNGDIFKLVNNKVTVTNTKISGTIKVDKNDTDNNLVEGVEFCLYKEGENTALETKTTGEDGVVLFENLPEGNYIVKEISVPDGYVLSKEEQTVSITESKVYNLSYTNKYTSLKIEKLDEYGNRLENANMQILDSNSRVIEEWVTNENMHEINKKLKTGENYILRETIAPTGFVKAEDIPFTVTDQGKIILNGEETEKIIVENKTLKGTINITKLGETLEEISEINKLEKFKVHLFAWKEKPIENVVYDLYAKSDIIVNGTKIYNKDEKISTITTGFDGVANYSGLTAGDYYIIEKSVPTQYELDNEKHDISLLVTYDENKNQKLIATTDLINERKKETIELTKTEKSSTIAVEGAIYGLYNQEPIGSISENTLLDVAMTNELGKGNFEADLPIGNYYVKEIESPDGYTLSEEIINVNFNESTDFKINAENDYTKVVIEKVDENEKYLKGAELQIINEEGNVIEKWITDNNAYEINKKLIAGGTYILQEITAPKGYEKAENITFKVSENGEVDTVKIVNKKEETNISEVTKNVIPVVFPKTGDTIIIYLIIIVTALGIIAFITILKIYLKKKK